MKIAVSTAVIGGIDQKKFIPEQTVEFERKFYTEPIDGVKGNDRMKALWYKCNPFKHTSADIHIWIDGKIQVQSANFIEQVITALGDKDIAVLKHHERSCIYQEVDHIEHCMKKGNEYLLTRYANKPIRKQVEAYRYFGYPANNGLNDCAIIVVRKWPTMVLALNEWWKDVYLCDGFDQTALQFHCWNNGIKIQPIIFTPGSYTDIPHVILK